MVNGIKTLTDSIARMYGVPADRLPTYTITSEVPAVLNDPALTLRATTAMKNVLGDDRVFPAGKPHMGSEDFHLLGGKGSDAKVLMVEVGSGPADVRARMAAGNLPVFPHNPSFYMDPDAVLYGTRALSAVLLDLLQKQQVQ
jgi:hippurate hydrolase